MTKKRNILITGGGGFVGKSLTLGLSPIKYNIFAPTHNELDILNKNLLSDYVINNNIEIIIHTAIKGGKNILSDTLRMFDNVMSLSDRVDKIIHLGSGAEYSKTRDLKKISEDEFGKYIPVDDYGFAKYICSKLSRNYDNVLTLRIFGLYGKYDDYLYKFISNSIAKNLFGLPIKIRQNVVFDYLYIDDFIKIVDFFIDNKINVSACYNVTPSESISLVKIAEIINSISNIKSKIEVCDKKLNYEYTGSNFSLMKQIPNISFTSYYGGIKFLFNYLNKNKKKLDLGAIIDDSYYLNVKVKN